MLRPIAVPSNTLNAANSAIVPVPFFCADLQMAHVSKGLTSNSNTATSTFGVLSGYLVGDRET